MPIQKEKRARLAPNTPPAPTTNIEGWPNSVNSRAERSRHAAKMRRDKEKDEMSALSKLLPYPEEVTKRLERGSIIRLTISYLRMKKFSQREGTALLDELKKKAITAETSEKTDDQPQVNDGALMLQALNGFILFISRKGGILYVSDNVGKQIGIHQYDMIGNSIMDFIHPDDQKELAKQFVVQLPGQQTYKGYGMENPDDSPTVMNVNFFDEAKSKEEKPVVTDYIQDRHFFLRMKSVVSRRSMGGKGKVVGYRVVNFTGRLKLKGSNNSKGYSVEGLICLCRPIQPQPILEIRMDGNMFMSRHGLDMSFTFCDPRIITLVGYEPHEVVGKTAYQFHNPLDAHKVSDCHSKLIVKGSSMSKYYRFLGKLGSWVWMQTKATIIYNTNNVAQYVVCMNYVIGKDEGERHLLMEQMAESFQVSDSDSCGSPSTPGTPGTPGACSSISYESDDMASPKIMELKEEELAELVPQSVRENQPILKPLEDSISFKGLSKESASSREDVAMEIGIKDEVIEEENLMQCDDVEVKNEAICDEVREDPMCAVDISALEKQNESCVQNGKLIKAHSPASDIESITSSESESACSPPSQKQYSTLGENEERELLNLLELPEDKDMPPVGDFPQLSFTVPSPDNLSQILSSPGSLCTSREIGSPSMAWLDDDIFSADKLKSPANNILLNLLNESVACEKGPMQESCNSQTIKQLLLSSRVVDMSRTSSALPADLADFSLEYASNLSCPEVDDASTSAGNATMDNGAQSQNSEGCGVVISDIVEQQAAAAADSERLCSSRLVAPTPATSQYSGVTAGASGFEACSRQSIPPGSSLTQTSSHPDSHGVTEGMSRLEIEDYVASQLQKRSHSMLKALLTGVEKNPLSVQPIPEQVRPTLANNADATISDLLGPITPSTKAVVETLDSLMQDHLDTNRDLSINNNQMNTDDLTLLQRQQQQKQLLEHEFRLQQQMLMETHQRQQELLEQEHRHQLIQRQALQQQMITKQAQMKIVNGGSPNRLPQSGITHSAMAPNGMVQSSVRGNPLHLGGMTQQNGMSHQGTLSQQNGVAEQNGSLLGPSENVIDIAGLNGFDFQQLIATSQHQVQQSSHFQVNGNFSSPQTYQAPHPPQQQGGLPRQPLPYQQGSPPISLPHSSPQLNPSTSHHSSNQSSLLAARLLGQSSPTSQLQSHQQPIQQSLPPSFHTSNEAMPGFSQQANQASCSNATLSSAPSEWQGDKFAPLGPSSRVFITRQADPLQDHNNFQEPCSIQQQLQF